MFRDSMLRRAANPLGLALAAAIGSSGPAWAEHGFQDCAIIDHSHASPFVQSRAQLTLLNLISSTGAACNLIEFRIAEMAKRPTISDVDGVRRQWWKELWGINQCGAAKVYEVWFQEIGLGGVSFSAELEEDPPADFVARMAAGTPLPADQMVASEDDRSPARTAADDEAKLLAIAKAAIAEKDEPAEMRAGDDLETNYLAIAKAAVAAKNVARTIIATPPPAAAEGTPAAAEEAPSEAKEAPAETKEATAGAKDMPSGGALFPGRELAFKSPNFKGHDVCAVQRALIGEEISVGVDGAYGPGMKKGVAKFQKRHGLKPTGVVNEETRTALSYPEAGEQKTAATKKAK